MAERTVKARLVVRNDTARNWTQRNPVLLWGEMGVETDTGKFKFGDGLKAWALLPYTSPTAADVPLAPVDGMSARTVQDAVAENFRSVVDGKNLLETAVTDKGGTVSKAGNVATFAELKDGITGISSGDECVITYENYNPIAESEKQSLTNLSEVKSSLAAATLRDRAIFAGGYSKNPEKYSSSVDAYGKDGIKVSFSALSIARANLAAATVGIKVILAGGFGANAGFYSTAEAYTEDGARTTLTSLSRARSSLAAAAIGNRALFAGGFFRTTIGNTVNVTYYVDIDAYTADGTKTTFSSLPQARSGLVATTVGSKAIFAGGYSRSYHSTVDVFTEDGTRLTFPDLSQPKQYIAATTVGTRAIFAGGGGSQRFSDAEAYLDDGSKLILTNLDQARDNLAAATTGDKAIFAGGYDYPAYFNIVEAYSEDGTKLTLAELRSTKSNLAATTVGVKAIFAGGLNGSTVFSTVDAFVDAETVSLKIISGGSYDFGEGEVTIPGDLTDPTIKSIAVPKPVNGYIKYKGMTING